jgi:hypothetical protein
MRFIVVALPAVILAGAAAAQSAGRPSAADPKAAVPAVQYRSAFEGYRPFADQELADWRKANEGVAAAGGHGAHRPGQGGSEQVSKPQPGKPGSAGEAAEKSGEPSHGGHHR